MSRKLTDKEIAFLENLQHDSELFARGFIRKFIVRNSYEPKYKIGDFVKVTDDTSTYICGERIKELNAVITNIDWMIGPAISKDDECVQYELEVLDQNCKSHVAFAEESFTGKYEKRRIVGYSDTYKNTFKNVKTKDMTIC